MGPASGRCTSRRWPSAPSRTRARVGPVPFQNSRAGLPLGLPRRSEATTCPPARRVRRSQLRRPTTRRLRGPPRRKVLPSRLLHRLPPRSRPSVRSRAAPGDPGRDASGIVLPRRRPEPGDPRLSRARSSSKRRSKPVPPPRCPRVRSYGFPYQKTRASLLPPTRVRVPTSTYDYALALGGLE